MSKEKLLYIICIFVDLILPKRFKQIIPVLLYHSIGDEFTSLTINKKEFERQIEYLNLRGYKSISPNKIVNANYKNKIILITFDDGFRNNLTIVFSILEKYNFKATIFLSTNYIGSLSTFCSDEKNKSLEMLKKDEIKYLDKKGWSICNHFHTHNTLTGLSDNEIINEYKNSKNILKKIVKNKRNAEIISYPRNKFDNNIVKLMKNERVKLAFGGKNTAYYKDDNEMSIPRIVIDRDVNFTKFKLNLSPTFQLLKKILKKW